ncbi:MAG: DUF192 domain-containing protein [Candidatus Methylacidiphilales bacterium]
MALETLRPENAVRLGQLGRAIALLGLLILPSACGTGEQDPTSFAPLPIRQLVIEEVTLEVEVASDEPSMQRGLMFRRSLPENAGMLFVYPRPQQASFWMKNTFLPLSIAYIDREGFILEIHPLEPLDTRPVKSASYRVSYALEVNRGWFEKNHIRPGHRIDNLPSL